MKCANCGANLLDTDQFCSKCGAKAVRSKRCPGCGALLRDGTKFCHECGRLVEGDVESGVSQETLDIPIEVIERNILSETAAEVRADKRATEHRRAPKEKSTEHRRAPEERTAVSGKKNAAPPPRKKTSPAPPPKKKRPVYEKEEWDDEDWDEEEWDEEDEGPDVFGILTAVAACVILFVAAFIAFQLYRQYVPKSYEKAAKQQVEEEEQEEPGEQEGDGIEPEVPQPAFGNADEEIEGTIRIVSNVNVRDYPSTEGSNVLKVAKAGETYEYYEIVEDNWVKVRLGEDGGIGYLHKDYMEIVE